jgi:DNA primase
MAHQHGVGQVVATMGTALNARHIKVLKRWHVDRVVLVFDADEGGDTGVDRALQLFVSHDLDLAVATLPPGLDPCDLLVQQGPAPFRAALENAVDALEFKLNRVMSAESANGIEGRRRAVDAVLSIVALAPDETGRDGSAVKRELVVSRIAQRMALKEETVWARLEELRAANRGRESPETIRSREQPEAEQKRQAPAPQHERELLQVLLAESGLVPAAAAEVAPEHIEHPGLRTLLGGLYALQAAGQTPDLDHLRPRLDNVRLVEFALKEQETGRSNPDRSDWLRRVLAAFHNRRVQSAKRELQNQLHAASDHTEAVRLLQQLRDAEQRGF